LCDEKSPPKFFWRALVPASGRPLKYFQGGENDILLISFRFLTTQCKMTYTKRFALSAP